MEESCEFTCFIYFKLLDESLKEYELLFLGIFHTYLYGE